jgi:hypothetical protein
MAIADIGLRGKRPHEMDKQRIRSYDDGIKKNMALTPESWLYLPSSNNEKRIFHFFGIKKVLVSMIYNNDFISAISDWDPVFEKISFENRHSMSLNSEFGTTDNLKESLSTSAKTEIITGLGQDRSNFNLNYKQIYLGMESYKFRSENNKTQLLIAFYLPIPEIFNELSYDNNTLNILHGYSFYNGEWDVIAEKRDSIVYKRETDGKKPRVKFVSFEVDTGVINCSVFCVPSGINVSCFNRNVIKIPEFSKTNICASDLMISVIDYKATGNGKKWNNTYLLPSPTNKWSLKKPINLYYEIYNLKKNLEGKSLFRLEYAFRYKGNNENVIGKIFSKDNNEIVSAEYTKSGKETESNECMSFDINKLSAGNYVIEITITDMNTNKNITLKKEEELF